MENLSPWMAVGLLIQRVIDSGVKDEAIWWPDLESNQGHKDFQSFALPTELSGLEVFHLTIQGNRSIPSECNGRLLNPI